MSDTLERSEWQNLDAAHHLHPFSDPAGLAQQGVRVITRAEGVHLWDENGARILDGMSGLWCVNLGYGRHDLVEAARAQLETLPYYNTFFKTSHPAVIELSALLTELAPAGFSRVFYTNSGSESVDTMIRMVRRYWDIAGQPHKKTLIGRINGYHGSTIGAASLGGMRYMHEQGDLPIPGIVHIEQPWWYGLARPGETPEQFGLRAAGWLEEKILEIGPEQVAAFVGEPVQGAGGVIIPPASYWPEIERICRKYDVLLVADEVICGFGRTGNWFGFQSFGFTPDLFTAAKGLSSGYLPIGAVMVGERVGKTLEQGGDFNHGFTYSGHPAAAAVAVANLRALRREKVVEQVAASRAPHLQQAWREAFEGLPHIDDVRGIGMLAAFTLVDSKVGHQLYADWGREGLRCRDVFFGHNLIMRACGDHIVTAPALVMAETDIDELVALARRCVEMYLSS